MGALLTAKGLTLAYGGRRVLDGVDLALARGETLALLGPNGAGKTSLMRLVAGRLPPDAGTVHVEGRVPHADRAARAATGWVPQEIALYPRLSVAENLGVFASLAGVPRRSRAAAVAAAMVLTDIEPIARRLVGQLSGGYQRRVNIAASLMNRPRLVLLDEPTQGVDLTARAAIHAVLRRLRSEGAAILIATHDFGEAERLADRVAFMAQGRIVREGVLTDLLVSLRAGAPEREVILSGAADGQAEATLRRLGFAPHEAGLVWRTAERGSGLDGAALLGTLRAQGVPASEVRVRAPGLESLYLDALRPRQVTGIPSARAAGAAR
ncbi:Linearmycin resistance ATP-binding protein LnrL [Methylorubrum populi]